MVRNLLILTGFLIICNGLQAQDDVRITEETVDTEESGSHIWFLASDELKGRDTGSPEIEIAASYIASRFRSYGVKEIDGSYFQNVPLESVKPPSAGSFMVEEFSFEIGNNLIVMQAGDLMEEAEIHYLEYALPEELSKLDLSNKIVVCRAGSEEMTDPRQFFGLSAEKRKAASKAGALAIFETYNSTAIPWSLLMNYLNREQLRMASPEDEGQDGSFAHAWLSDPKMELSSYLKGAKEVVGKAEMGAMDIRPLPSKNVVGIIEGTDPQLKDEYILLSAHYDHVGFKEGTNGEDSIYNGARDNATGVAAILAAAKSLSANPAKRSIVLLACTGEEKGLLGSRYFADNPPIPLEQIVFNLNSDGGGYNDTSIASIMGLTRTNAEEAIKTACEAFGLGTLADPAPEQNLFDRSDNVNFARLGIPAPTFSTGFTEFNAEINKYYHQVTDNPDTMDYEYLGKFFKAYALAARRIANMDEKPFWNEGDKYEEAGKKLYGLE